MQAFKFAEELKEMLALPGGKGTGGFVHDDDLRGNAECGGDLNDLLLTGGKIANERVQRDVCADLVEHELRLLPHAFAADESGGDGQTSETEVFGHGQVWAKR